ncbi:50S ribosomal protein L29 [Polynucleobacter sp. SHI8]|jgi:large subunit ribosomal protein L29|uniref:50S ribosomal protein L29 n=1 Tax=unclassified Polynucleobacter TaxID=2640945 RepID=UPI002492CEDC|nr:MULTISPECIES: 50S ribosomal protein L29 [unclassified Polynucleobacter]BDW09980.1 50S ribosomal protein L29 [Polynucleobacter sp. SHI2]BDW12426.1 50S ribosomal protein L29 [Polynucleobacter sp. SHI8]
MEMKELLAKDVKGLNNELSELLKAQFKLRMQKGTQQLQDSSQLSKTKKAIARVKTALNQKAAEK